MALQNLPKPAALVSIDAHEEASSASQWQEKSCCALPHVAYANLYTSNRARENVAYPTERRKGQEFPLHRNPGRLHPIAMSLNQLGTSNPRRPNPL